MTACEEVRIRRMTVADLDRVMEIAAGLKEAPHWARAAYLAAIDPAGAPRRIALVAESGSLAGFAVASVVMPQAELETIAVTGGGAAARGCAEAVCGAGRGAGRGWSEGRPFGGAGLECAGAGVLPGVGVSGERAQTAVLC